MEEKSARHSFVHNMLRLDIQSRFFYDNDGLDLDLLLQSGNSEVTPLIARSREQTGPI